MPRKPFAAARPSWASSPRTASPLLVDKRISTKLLEAESIEKIFKIDDHIGAVASGLVADGRALVDRVRVEAQVNHVTYGEPISIEILAKKISDHIQTFTQYGGVRPYGSALLIAGIDETGPAALRDRPVGSALRVQGRIHRREPQHGHGDAREPRSTSTMSIDEVIMLGIEALYKSMESKGEMPTIEIGIIDAKTRKFRKLSEAEVKEYIEKAGVDKPGAEPAKRSRAKIRGVSPW